MRPEYIEAVDAARYGYTLWLPFVPVVLIWCAALRCKRGVVMFFIAWGCSWFLLVNHSNAIQAAKERNAQTEEEFKDWSADTWNTFAPMTAVPYTLIYCLAHASVAYTVFGAGRMIYCLVQHGNETTQETTSDYASYRAKLVREYNEERGE